MPLIAQMCMLVVTIALVGLAVLAIRLMQRTILLIENANRSLAELPALIADVKRTSARADELLLAFSRITLSAHAGVTRFEGLVTRSSDIASALLDEVEKPVSRVIAVMRGLRLGASVLMERWGSRARRHADTPPAEHQQSEQRWLDDGGPAVGNGPRGRPGADVRVDGGR